MADRRDAYLADMRSHTIRGASGGAGDKAVRMSGSKRSVFPCSCHDFHFMIFEWFPEDKHPDPELWVQAYLSVGGRDWDSWKERLTTIWRVLRGRETSSYEVILRREDVMDLRNDLNDYLAAAERLNTETGLAGMYDAPPMVCTMHMRFIPCGSSKTGCVISDKAEDVERVRKFQGDTAV
jgi:hypothetical protein